MLPGRYHRTGVVGRHRRPRNRWATGRVLAGAGAAVVAFTVTTVVVLPPPQVAHRPPPRRLAVVSTAVAVPVHETQWVPPTPPPPPAPRAAAVAVEPVPKPKRAPPEPAPVVVEPAPTPEPTPEPTPLPAVIAEAAPSPEPEPPAKEPDPGQRTYDLPRVQPHVRAAAQELGNRFGIERIGGYRTNAIDADGHPAGLALDLFASPAVGDKLANYAIEHADRLRIKYIMWQSRIYRIDSGRGWEPVKDRGSVTANHGDHAHLGFLP